jgi:hypothetical protein
VQLDVVLAVALGRVHGGVGTVQQRLGGVPGDGERAADAGGD